MSVILIDGVKAVVFNNDKPVQLSYHASAHKNCAGDEPAGRESGDSTAVRQATERDAYRRTQETRE
jgi:hypothetical protein